MSPADLEQAAAALVARTCEAQGLPLAIDDAATLDKVAALLNGIGAPKGAGTTTQHVATSPQGGRRDQST